MYASKNGNPKMRGSKRFASGTPSVKASTGMTARTTVRGVVGSGGGKSKATPFGRAPLRAARGDEELREE